MNEVDSRVVEMRFDNKHFEQNVQTSLNTLSKLKESLKFTDTSRGLENIEEASRRLNFNVLNNAVETVKMKFSALEVVAITALANITNSAINAGKQMLHSLTIEPIKQGFSEYELKMGSIQTIMASTGASLDEVNKYLSELNEYSDKTIYSFADMTQSIGKFTNAGVSLDDAVKAIQGISNEAAISGANANEASRAMYNFAQALSAGSVKHIDWKSIELANMATVEFKNELIKTAVELGTLKKVGDRYVSTTTDIQGHTSEAFNATSLFNESLNSQWMSTDVLIQTLGRYADETTEIGKKAFSAAQDVKTFSQLMDTLKEAVGSGWAETWELVFGNLEEAKKLWTGINTVVSDYVENQSRARNDILRGWVDTGGKEAFIDALKNIFNGAVSAIAPVKEAFRDIFPPITSKSLTDISNKFKDITEKFKLTDEAANNLKRTFKGVFAVAHTVKEVFSSIFKAITPLFGGIGSLSGGILEITAKIGDYLVNIDKFITESNVLDKVFQTITDTILIVKETVSDFINTIKEKFIFPGFELFHGLLERMHERLSMIGSSVEKTNEHISDSFENVKGRIEQSNLVSYLEGIWKSAKTFSGKVMEVISQLFSGLVDKVSNADFSGVFDIFNGISLAAIGKALYDFIHGLTDTLDSVSDIKEGIVDILSGVKDCFKAYQDQLQANTLVKIATAIGVLAASILVISLIDSKKLLASLGAITILFTDLMIAMNVFGKNASNFKSVTKSCGVMMAMASAILILSVALKQVADIDSDKLLGGLLGVAGLTAMMVTAVKVLNSGSKKVIKGAAQMVLFAAAIKVLASACKDLSSLNWFQLSVGLVGVGALLAEVSLFLQTAKFTGKSITTATGIVILSAAIKILASACKDFSTMKWEEIGKGLASIGGLLLELSIFTNLSGNADHVISTGIALVAISGAMKIFASALQDFSSMKWDQITVGLGAMGGVLAEVAIAVNLMPKNMIGIGLGLIAVGAALKIVASALSDFSSMKWDQVSVGLTALGGSMAILAIGLNAMKGTLSGSLAMVVAAGALAVLTPVLSILGAMSWSAIAKGLISIAGAFTVVGVAGLLLAPLTPALLGLAGAFALIGAGMLGLGVSLLAAGAGLSAIAVGITALITAVSVGAASITAAMVAIGTGIANGILAICQVISGGSAIIGETFTSLVLVALSVLSNCIPQMVETGAQLLLSILTGIANHIQEITSVTLTIISEFLLGIKNGLPQIIASGVDIMIAFITAIANEVPRLVDAGYNAIVDFINGLADAIRDNTEKIVEAFFNLAGAMVEGLVDGLLDGVKSAVKGIKELGTKVIDGFKEVLGIHSPSKVFKELGKNTVEGYNEGLEENTPEAKKATEKLANEIIHKAYETFEVKNEKSNIFAKLGVANMQGFIDGLKSMGQKVKTTLANTLCVDKDTLTKIQSTIDEAIKTIQSRLESYEELASDRMNRIDTEAKVSVDEMIANLEHNQMAIEDWANGIAELAERGLNDGLLEELREAGPKSAGEVKALVNATDSELERLNEVMSRSGEVATNALITSVGKGAELMKQPGQSMAEALATGLTGSNSLNNAMSLVLSQALETANSGTNVTAIQNVGKNLAEGLGTGITNNTNIVTQAATTMANATNDTVIQIFDINSPSKLYAEYGMYLLQGLAEGLTTYQYLPLDALTALFNQMEFLTFKHGMIVLLSFKNGLLYKRMELYLTIINTLKICLLIIQKLFFIQFFYMGQLIMICFIKGIKFQQIVLWETFVDLINSILLLLNNAQVEFYNAGMMLVQGLANGIIANSSMVVDSVRTMVQAAVEAAKTELDINSPSKVTYEIGTYFGMGFSNAISDSSHSAYNAAQKVAKSAKDGLNDAIARTYNSVETEMNLQPVIRPVLDLSSVKQKSRYLNAMLSGEYAMNVNASINRHSNASNTSDSTSTSGVQSISFTQNNYSPKALSRIDIYRHTKNQISTMKGMVKA